MKLFHKLLLGFFTVALMSWVTGFFAVNHSKEVLRDAFKDNSEFLAMELLDGIEKGIQSKIDIFSSYTHDLILQEGVSISNRDFKKIDDVQAYIDRKDKEWISIQKDEITPFMKSIMSNRLSEELSEMENFFKEHYGYIVFGEIFVTNKHGANIAQTGKTTDYRQDDEKWWQAAKSNGLFVQDIAFDESANVYSIDIAIRIDDKQGNFSGVLKVVLNIETALAFIREVEKERELREMKTLDFKILNEFGKLIYSTKDYELLEDASYLIPAGHFDPEYERPRVYSETQKRINKESKVFVSHVHSTGKLGLNWIMVVEQDEDILFAPITRLKNRIFTIALIITLGGILIGFLISRSVSDTVNKLKNAAVRIGKGDLDTEVEVRSNDEIGELAESFRQMTKDLKSTTVARDELVQEVEKRKEKEKELSEFKLISDYSNDAHFLLGRDAKFTYVNKTACSMFGYTEKELLTLGVADVDALYDIGKFQELFDLIQKESLSPVESVIRKKDGAQFPCEITVTGYQIDDKPYMFAALRDTTERKQVEEALMKAKTEIEEWNMTLARRVSAKTEELEKSQIQLIQSEKLAAMGQLSAGLAHELNSPLAGLLPLLQKYKKTAEAGSEAYSDMTLMLRASEHMAKIVRDFGSFAGKPTKEHSALSINDIIESTLSFCSGELEMQGIEIVKEYGDRLSDVFCSKTELQQVVLNIITNARDAMPDGGTFIIKTSISGDEVKAEFTDNGVGISNKDIARVFDPFFTTKPQGMGIGLGLSISYGIIKNHNGDILVQSELKKGSKFTVLIPAIESKGETKDG